MLEYINSILSGILMPALLMGAGLAFSLKLKLFHLLHPVRSLSVLKQSSSSKGQTPLRATSVALAGTLGVGNIAGVATAITAGGEGALFWMLAGSFLAMSVKYAEVSLAVRHRRLGKNGFYGGAMYYISDTVSPALGSVFALLCIANSLITGNVIQVNAAASVLSDKIPPLTIGCLICILTLAVTVGSVKRISDVTVRLIPALSVFYLSLSLWIILTNLHVLPSLFSRVIRSALDVSAFTGGVGGFGVSRALRYGVTRGLLSNEAGCGSAPTAHAAADTVSPHSQGLFGMLEVLIDTVVCAVTATVILLLPAGFTEDGVRLTLLAYSSFAGDWAAYALAASVILFALATVICQSYYGTVALGYFTQSPRAKKAFFLFFALCSIAGSVIAPPLMWGIADLCVSLMTAINTLVLLWLFFSKRLPLGDVDPSLPQKEASPPGRVDRA